MKALIVEDDQDARAVLRALLAGSGHEVLEARDGLEALTALRTARPDLIVSDILMPRVDGFDLCRIVKADHALAKIPFVFYTATYTDRRDERFGLALGADLFLLKPMEPLDLLRRLEGVVDQAGREAGTNRSMTNGEVALSSNDLSAEQLAIVSRKLEKKVSELEYANAALEASEFLLDQLMSNIHECFWMVSAGDGRLIYASASMSEVWGFSPSERQASPGIWLERIHPDDREAVGRGHLQAATRARVDSTFRVLKPDGELRWLRERAFPVTDSSGNVYRIAGVTEDVTDAHRVSERLRFHANHDTLTGLLNRGAFERQLAALLAEPERRQTRHALCYIDLDQFKVVNDSCGHAAGDQLLRELSQDISARVRKTDSFARLGGDEFGVLMPHCTLEQATRLARAVVATVSAYRFSWKGATFSVTASIGVVPLEVEAAQGTILAAADAACYVAKELGGNRFHVYSDDDEALAARHGEMQWVSRLADAMEEERLELHYQGIHSMGEAAAPIDKVELLLRIREPDGELIFPGAFMSAAHRYQLAPRLDRAVLAKAFEWLAGEGTWVKSCSINLTAPSLSDKTLLPYVQNELARWGLDGSRICFEITETAALGNLSEVRELMQRLRDLGCEFSVDDFGSGFSSFAYLKALPIDYLKIDGEFVVEMASDPLQRAMVRSMNEIGHAIGSRTVAEWVETDEVLELLREIGVDYVQGFHLSRPAPCQG